MQGSCRIHILKCNVAQVVVLLPGASMDFESDLGRSSKHHQAFDLWRSCCRGCSFIVYSFSWSSEDVHLPDKVPGAEDPVKDACRTCSLQKEKGFPYCKIHKACYQCLERHSHKKERAGGGYVCAEQAAAFDTIFGKGRDPPPNLPLANKVILQFERNNPSLSMSGSKTTSKKTALDLTTFTHERGNFQEKADIDDEYMWDEELFVMQMKLLRGWSQPHASSQWTDMHSIPGAVNDNGGPKNTPRTLVPANLIGASFQRKSQGEYEKRAVSHATKPQKNLGQEAVDSMQAQTNQGFGYLGSNGSSSAWHSAGDPSSSIMRPGEVRTSDASALLLDAVGHLAGTACSPAKVKPEDGVARMEIDGGATAVPSEAPLKLDPKTAPCNPVARNQVVRSLSSEISTEVGKLRLALKSVAVTRSQADGTHDKDALDILDERIAIANHCLGEKAGLVPKSDPAEKDTADLETLLYFPWVGERKFNKAELSAAMVQHASFSKTDGDLVWDAAVADATKVIENGSEMLISYAMIVRAVDGLGKVAAQAEGGVAAASEPQVSTRQEGAVSLTAHSCFRYGPPHSTNTHTNSQICCLNVQRPSQPWAVGCGYGVDALATASICTPHPHLAPHPPGVF